MPDIDRPSHLMPSTHPLAIAASSEEEEGDETDDDRTLAKVIKGKSMKNSQEGARSMVVIFCQVTQRNHGLLPERAGQALRRVVMMKKHSGKSFS
jgi:hypothetical protein